MKPTEPVTTHSSRTVYYVTGGALVVVLLIGAVIVAVAHKNQTNDDSATPAATATPTPSLASPIPTASPTPLASTSPTPSPTTTASPSPTPSSAALSSLPAAAQTTVKTFYVAYEGSNAANLSPLFTPDTTNDLQSLHSELFFGKDTKGIPGGPTLFVSSSVLEHPTSYSVTSASQVSGSWKLAVTEQRLDGNGKALPAAHLTVVLSPAANGTDWLINQYSRTDSGTKYDGFFTQ